MNISIIISTYNRCEHIKDALDTLLGQEQINILDYEIIVVDNNSKDKTKEVVSSYMSRFNGKMRYFFEPRQGKSYALNLGIQEAKGEIIVFTDDDVIVDKRWLYGVYAAFRDHGCDAIGGRVLPLYPKIHPSWIVKYRDLLRGPIVAHDFGEDNKEYGNSMSPFVGSNMAIKRDVLNEIGLFDAEQYDGQPRPICEDSDFFRRLRKTSKKIYYCGKAIVWHPVDKKRMSLIYIAKWYFLYGKYAAISDYAEEGGSFVYYFGIPRFVFRKIIENFISIMFSYPYEANFLKKWMLLFTDIGMISQYRKMRKCLKSA